MKSITAAVALAAAAILIASPALAAPTPSEVPVSWQMEIEVQKPRSIEIEMPGQAKPRLFWFVIYTVTNQTGEDRIFVPEFILYTDTGQMIKAAQKVPTLVYKAIKDVTNEPLLQDVTGMTGKILQGEDNAKTGAAIWTDFDGQAGQFDIFVGRLTGETVEIELPDPVLVKEVDNKGNLITKEKTTIVLSKTLKLEYQIPGEAEARPYTEPVLVKKSWVMR